MADGGTPTAPSALPAALASGVQRAASAIGPDGELPAAARGVLHGLVDEAGRGIHPEAARYVRAKLALACAYAGLPVLAPHPAVRIQAESLASATVATMRGDVDADALEEQYEAAMAHADDLLLSGTVDPPAVYALRACTAAASTLLYDADALGEPELRADPSDWEACFFASLAVTGGATWDGVGDAEVRARFWRWYLDVALPYAWDPFTPLVPYPTDPPAS